MKNYTHTQIAEHIPGSPYFKQMIIGEQATQSTYGVLDMLRGLTTNLLFATRKVTVLRSKANTQGLSNRLVVNLINRVVNKTVKLSLRENLVKR